MYRDIQSIFFILMFVFSNSFYAQSESKTNIKSIKFKFQPVIAGVEKVFVAGTFNDWNGSKNAMSDPDGDGVFETSLLIPPGRYLYKFVVDGNWLADPNAKAFEPDGQGGRNGVFFVSEELPDVTIKKGDGLIRIDDIPLTMDYSMVNVLEKGLIEFKIRSQRDDVESAQLIYVIDSNEPLLADMSLTGEDELFSFYKTQIRLQKKQSSVWFTFILNDGGRSVYASPKGFVNTQPSVEDMFFYSSDILPPFKTPDWAKEGVFYQIFPDRFRNGDKSNDPDFSEPYYEGLIQLPENGILNDEYFHLVEDWDNIAGLTRSPFRDDGRPDYFSFYGGDIAGVFEKLDYLKDLGVTIIYFNPVNAGKSNHKYDPIDYLKIDPHFADGPGFKKFVKAAHKKGIRIIVDMAFNHTGDWHFAFVDTKEKGEKSKYWNWYEWNKWPLPPEGPPTPCDYYDCWWGFPLHPNLNFDLSRPNDDENDIRDIKDADPNMEVVDYVLDVARYWIGELDIDGFRLDVPNEVPHWVWKEFRAVVDSLKPDAFLIGEIWGNAMPWMGPEGFHATMNYKYFRDPVLQFFGMGKGDAQQFDRSIYPGRHIYPVQATRVMMNLIDSHDTERFLTLAGGDIRRLKLAALFQMAYVGIPQIYYGDEVGLEGGKDPDNRRTFPWDWEKSEKRRDLSTYYKQIIKLRKKYRALRSDNYETLLSDGKKYAFCRWEGGEYLVIALNNHAEKQTLEIALNSDKCKKLKDLFSGEVIRANGDQIRITLDAYQGTILKK